MRNLGVIVSAKVLPAFRTFEKSPPAFTKKTKDENSHVITTSKYEKFVLHCASSTMCDVTLTLSLSPPVTRFI